MTFDLSIGDKVRVKTPEGGTFVAMITDRLFWAPENSSTGDNAPCYYVQEVDEVQGGVFSGDGGPPPRSEGWFFAGSLILVPVVDLLADLLADLRR